MISTQDISPNMDSQPSYPYFHADTLDDLMRLVFASIFSQGQPIKPSKGVATELTGVFLELRNPRARLSRTETRGKSFSPLAELCWYLAKTNKLDFISYYMPAYRRYADGDIIFGGYGPRLFNWKGLNQIENVTNILKKNPDSRKAVIQLFDAQDITEIHNDIPCTCTLQFMPRGGKLHLLVNMRSNDAYLGLPHDVFSFTMLQEIVARTLSVEVGIYKQAIGSLHLYKRDEKAAKRYLGEGWQSTTTTMPTMPIGDPWANIATLLQAESMIRTTGSFPLSEHASLDQYWADFIKLLQIFRHKKDSKKDSEVATIKVLRDSMSSKMYHPFIDSIINSLTK